MTSDKRENTAYLYGKKNKFYYYRDMYQKDEHHCKGKCSTGCRKCNTGCDKCSTGCDKCSTGCDKCSKGCDKCNKKSYEKDYKDEHTKKFDMNTGSSDATVSQEADQYDFMEQESAELIWVKESCNITVNSTDTQVGVSLQAGLQLAITLVLNVTLGDSNRGEAVSQELMQNFNAEQVNKQKIFICNSKDINVTTTDTDLVINIQVLLQLLLALVVMVDIL